MGTNYYAEDGTHIGKRYAAGGGRMGFIWAVGIGRMEAFRRFSEERGEPWMNRQQFTAMLAECSEQDFRHIGIEFR